MLWQQALIAAIRVWLLAAVAVRQEQDAYQPPVVNQDGDVVQ